jgi:hypothetical protein
MDNENLKSGHYIKNNRLEYLLKEINYYLENVNNAVPFESSKFVNQSYPSIFIVGVPRSGTTILSQWLASTNEFCYPSNFISRFYQAPFFGGLIQELLFNKSYDYKNELSIQLKKSFNQSDIGKTQGILEPHEFWYFWRRFFNFPDIPVSHTKFLETANFSSFESEIKRFKMVFNKPFFMKALIMNPYLVPLANSNPLNLIVYIRRDKIANMDSLLRTRQKYFNNENTWFSFKPKEYSQIVGESNFRQVAAQAYFIRKDIESQLNMVDESQKWIIDYEDFIANPDLHIETLKNKMFQLGFNLNIDQFSFAEKIHLQSNPIQNQDYEDAFDWVMSLKV